MARRLLEVRRRRRRLNGSRGSAGWRPPPAVPARRCGSTPTAISTRPRPRRAATCTGCRSLPRSATAGRASKSEAWPLPALDPARTTLIGVRSLDDGERALLGVLAPGGAHDERDRPARDRAARRRRPAARGRRGLRPRVAGHGRARFRVRAARGPRRRPSLSRRGAPGDGARCRVWVPGSFEIVEVNPIHRDTRRRRRGGAGRATRNGRHTRTTSLRSANAHSRAPSFDC